MNILRSKYTGYLVHITAWAVILGIPLFVTAPNRPLMQGPEYVRFLLVTLSFMVVFYTNYFRLIERHLFTRHPGRFLGPWTKSEHNPILQSPGTLQGCGHHAIFKDKRHRYRVVFHAHHAPGQISPRIMHLTRLKFIPQKNTADRLIFLPDYFTPQLTRD